jgi:hypothetical protein
MNEYIMIDDDHLLPSISMELSSFLLFYELSMMA